RRWQRTAIHVGHREHRREYRLRERRGDAVRPVPGVLPIIMLTARADEAEPHRWARAWRGRLPGEAVLVAFRSLYGPLLTRAAEGPHARHSKLRQFKGTRAAARTAGLARDRGLRGVHCARLG